MTDTFTIVRHNPGRWFAWRDLVSILLGLTVLILVLEVGQLRRELSERPTSAQFQALTAQLTAKDARIAQLTDLLVRNRIPVPPAPSPVPSLIPTPGAQPTLTPSPPVSGPRPTPGRSPSQRPTRTPAPSPTCLVYVAATCLTQPPTPTLPPFLPRV